MAQSDGSASMVALQVVAGLIVSYLIYLVSLWVMHFDIINIDKQTNPNKNQEVTVFSGYVESSSLVNKQYNTVNRGSGNYMPLIPSVNRKGGAQFTYSFWIFLSDPELCINQCIFLRGDPEQYSYERTNIRHKASHVVQSRVSYCPMVSFGPNPMEFDIAFNTFDQLDQLMPIRNTKSVDPSIRKNLLPLFSNRWACITIVFEDHAVVSDFEDGINVSFYVNDFMYASRNFASTLKQNVGNLHFFPDGTAPQGCRLSGFKYFNYALTQRDVDALFRRGPNLNPEKINSASTNIPMYVSDYNKLDIYNT